MVEKRRIVEMAKKKQQYKTIQLDGVIQRQIVEYCDLKGLKIKKYIEQLFLANVSASGDESKLNTHRG